MGFLLGFEEYLVGRRRRAKLQYLYTGRKFTIEPTVNILEDYKPKMTTLLCMAMDLMGQIIFRSGVEAQPSLQAKPLASSNLHPQITTHTCIHPSAIYWEEISTDHTAAVRFIQQPRSEASGIRQGIRPCGYIQISCFLSLSFAFGRSLIRWDWIQLRVGCLVRLVFALHDVASSDHRSSLDHDCSTSHGSQTSDDSMASRPRAPIYAKVYTSD